MVQSPQTAPQILDMVQQPRGVSPSCSSASQSPESAHDEITPGLLPSKCTSFRIARTNELGDLACDSALDAEVVPLERPLSPHTLTVQESSFVAPTSLEAPTPKEPMFQSFKIESSCVAATALQSVQATASLMKEVAGTLTFDTDDETFKEAACKVNHRAHSMESAPTTAHDVVSTSVKPSTGAASMTPTTREEIRGTTLCVPSSVARASAPLCRSTPEGLAAENARLRATLQNLQAATVASQKYHADREAQWQSHCKTLKNRIAELEAAVTDNCDLPLIKQLRDCPSPPRRKGLTLQGLTPPNLFTSPLHSQSGPAALSESSHVTFASPVPFKLPDNAFNMRGSPNDVLMETPVPGAGQPLAQTPPIGTQSQTQAGFALASSCSPRPESSPVQGMPGVSSRYAGASTSISPIALMPNGFASTTATAGLSSPHEQPDSPKILWPELEAGEALCAPSLDSPRESRKQIPVVRASSVKWVRKDEMHQKSTANSRSIGLSPPQVLQTQNLSLLPPQGLTPPSLRPESDERSPRPGTAVPLGSRSDLLMGASPVPLGSGSDLLIAGSPERLPIPAHAPSRPPPVLDQQTEHHQHRRTHSLGSRSDLLIAASPGRPPIRAYAPSQASPVLDHQLERQQHRRTQSLGSHSDLLIAASPERPPIPPQAQLQVGVRFEAGESDEALRTPEATGTVIRRPISLSQLEQIRQESQNCLTRVQSAHMGGALQQHTNLHSESMSEAWRHGAASGNVPRTEIDSQSNGNPAQSVDVVLLKSYKLAPPAMKSVLEVGECQQSVQSAEAASLFESVVDGNEESAKVQTQQPKAEDPLVGINRCGPLTPPLAAGVGLGNGVVQESSPASTEHKFDKSGSDLSETSPPAIEAGLPALRGQDIVSESPGNRSRYPGDR